jgi:hypothetical protein
MSLVSSFVGAGVFGAVIVGSLASGPLVGVGTAVAVEVAVVEVVVAEYVNVCDCEVGSSRLAVSELLEPPQPAITPAARIRATTGYRVRMGGRL